MQAVVLADDLSGAAELGALGLRFGLTAEVQTDFDPSTSADLCLVDTDTRSCPAEAAVRRVVQVARRLLALPPVFVYKKVDSLLRGAVLAESRAIARTLGRQRVLLISANPSRGRVIREGRYYVNGVPLEQTLFAADPEHPRRTSEVRALLEDSYAGSLPPAVEAGLSEVSVAAPDVGRGEELAEWSRQLGGDTLPAGAADFFAALLAQRWGERHSRPAIASAGAWSAGTAGAAPTLVVCGSVASWPLRHAAARAGGLACVAAPGEVFAAQRAEAALRHWGQQIADALARHPAVLVGVGHPAGETSRALADVPSAISGAAPAAALARRLAEAVRLALGRVNVTRMLLEGGATAAAIVRTQGWNRLSVVGAPGPGVAELRPVAAAAGAPVSLLVKPGSYPWPDEVWASVVAGKTVPSVAPPPLLP